MDCLDEDEPEAGEKVEGGTTGKKKKQGQAKAKAKATTGSSGSQGGPSKVQATAQTLLQGQAIEEADLGAVVQYWNKQLSAEQARCVATVRSIKVAQVPRLELEGRLRNCAG